MKRLALWVFIILFHILSSPAESLRSLTASEGLSDLLVNCIYRDAQGYVWFGTSSTLDRFDGNQIKTFQFPGDNAAQKRVSDIESTPDGHIYAGNRMGLFRLDSPADTELKPVLADQINFSVNAIKSDGASTLYAATDHGLFIYDTRRNTARRILIQTDMLSKENEIGAIWLAAKDTLYAATGASLYRINPSSGEIDQYRFPGPSSHVTDISAHGDRLYIATMGSGIIVFNTKSQSFETPIHAGNDIVTDTGTSGNTLYIATDGEGLFKYDFNTGLVSHASTLGLRSHSLYSFLADSEGLLWIGYYQAGADYTLRIDPLFETYTFPNAAHPEKMTVRSLLIDGNKKLIGTREGLYYIDEATGTTRCYKTPEISSGLIFAIIKWHGLYYIGTYNGGLYELNPATLQLRRSRLLPPEMDGATVFVLKTDKGNDLWAGTSEGVFRFRDGKILARYTSFSSQLPAGNVYEIFFDSKGRGWICTESGMAIYNDGEIRSDVFPQGFIHHDKIRCIFEDSRGNLYFLPDRGTILKSDLGLTSSVKLRNRGDLLSPSTFAAEDRQGHIWFGTDRGLVRFDGKSHFHLFNRADGLPNPIFTLCTPNHDAAGNIWVGNTDGLIKIDPSKFNNPRRLHPRFSITDIESNGKSLIGDVRPHKGGDILDVESTSNNITFHYSNFKYIAPSEMVVEYRLEGVDQDWKMMYGYGPLKYYNLSPGEYTLEIRSPGIDDDSVKLRVRVAGKTNWAMILLSVLTLLLLIFGAYFYHQHRRKEEALEQRDEEARQEAVRRRQNLYKTTRLSNEECQRILRLLDRTMREQKPFTNPDLKIGDLAALCGVSAHALSFLFNQYLQKSYYDYVNQYRVDEFKRVVKEEDPDRYTLTALSQMCGFSSRASFFRHFKNITGLTPAEYLKRQK